MQKMAMETHTHTRRIMHTGSVPRPRRQARNPQNRLQGSHGLRWQLIARLSQRPARSCSNEFPNTPPAHDARIDLLHKTHAGDPPEGTESVTEAETRDVRRKHMACGPRTGGGRTSAHTQDMHSGHFLGACTPGTHVGRAVGENTLGVLTSGRLSEHTLWARTRGEHSEQALTPSMQSKHALGAREALRRRNGLSKLGPPRK